ncbi:MAG: hypothetical protein M3O70_23635 [Actinomycetota bacterium]|nr:hypothetical protein [Actinomycetota bacterium]
MDREPDRRAQPEEELLEVDVGGGDPAVALRRERPIKRIARELGAARETVRAAARVRAAALPAFAAGCVVDEFEDEIRRLLQFDARMPV